MKLLNDGALEALATIPSGSIHTVVTSPPYWGLRSYHGEPGMIGLEPTLQEHLANLVAVFEEVKRVLRDDGTVWLNYGDFYSNGGAAKGNGGDGGTSSLNCKRSVDGTFHPDRKSQPGSTLDQSQ